MKSWVDLPVRFIVSTGRTGTKFLANFFNDFLPKTVSLHEPEPDLLPMAIDRARGEIDGDRVKQRLRIGRKLLLRKAMDAGASTYLEANNRFFSIVPELLELFSDCRIVHIVRDGRDYVRSGMSRDKPWCDYYYGAEDQIANNDLRLKATMFPDDPFNDEWDQLSAFEKTAWGWVRKDQIIKESARSHDGVLTVRFEEIFDDEEFEGLQRLYSFLELDDELDLSRPEIQQRLNQPENVSGDYRIPHWRDWSEDRTESFDRIAGEHMREYGYYD